MARKKSERIKPKLKIIFKDGEVSHEKMIETAALILNEMLRWDYSEDENKKS